MNLVDRVKNILLNPKGEWPIIAGEATTTQALYTGYIMILAAIGPVAFMIRSLGFGGIGIVEAIITYILSLIMVYVVALIADMLAPTFGGEKNMMQSLKLVAYSCTATWLAGIFHLLGLLGGLLSLVALCYALYTFFLGVPAMKKCPADKAVPYTVVVVVCVLVLGAIIGALMRAMFWGGVGMGM
jgi:Yip1 domain